MAEYGSAVRTSLATTNTARAVPDATALAAALSAAALPRKLLPKSTVTTSGRNPRAFAAMAAADFSAKNDEVDARYT